MMFLRRSISLSVAFLVATKLEATVSGAASGADLETNVALSSATFWRLAHSEHFYRTTRVPTGNVRQRVVEISRWVSPDGKKNDGNTDGELTSAVSHRRGPTCVSALVVTPIERQLRREVVLAYDVSSPLGDSEAKSVQSLALGMEGGTITYSEASRVSGFPMMSGDICGKTTYAVTPSADDPNSVVVRVAVSVDEVMLPFAISWLKGRIRKTMRKDLIKSAQTYLDAMAKVEAEEMDEQRETTIGSTRFSAISAALHA